MQPVKDVKTYPGKFKLNFKHPGVQYPWKFNCPQPLCFYVIVAATEELIDKRIEEHTCPWFGGGTTTFSWGVMSDDYITPIWKMLDAAVDVMKNSDATAEEKTAARYGGRGLAEALAILMPPFFTDGDAIVREALVRWQHRQDGTEYTTPGIGKYKFRPPGAEVVDEPSWVKQPEYEVPSGGRPKAAPKSKPTHALSQSDQEAIKKAKGFPIAVLVAAYGVSGDVIKSIQES